MPRHVLLMLSSDQPPHPDEELAWHVAECARGSRTALVTTRVLSDLVIGRSTVAFYGNAALGNRYLGRGTYLGYVRLDSPAGRELRRETPIYRDRGVPDGARGFILLRDVALAAPGEDLTVLGGRIQASGLPLVLENIPRGASRIQVYYE